MRNSMKKSHHGMGEPGHGFGRRHDPRCGGLERGAGRGEGPYAETADVSGGECPHCERHCPAEEPQCPRGEDLHGEDPRAGGEWGMADGSDAGDVFGLIHRVAKLIGRSRRPGGGEHHGQRRVLAILAEKGTLEQRDLLEILDVRSSSLSELLAKLEVAGFLSRERDEADRRNFRVTITENGRERMAEGDGQAKRERAAALMAFSPEERETLRSLLEKLCRGLEKAGGHGREREGRHGHGGHGRHGGRPSHREGGEW